MQLKDHIGDCVDISTIVDYILCADEYLTLDILPLKEDDKVTPIINEGECRGYGDSLYFADMRELSWY